MYRCSRSIHRIQKNYKSNVPRNFLFPLLIPTVLKTFLCSYRNVSLLAANTELQRARKRSHRRNELWRGSYELPRTNTFYLPKRPFAPRVVFCHSDGENLKKRIINKARNVSVMQFTLCSLDEVVVPTSAVRADHTGAHYERGWWFQHPRS